MIPTICLLSCVLAAGQAKDRADWQLSPQLAPGLELVYTGSYVEESLIPNVAHQVPYRLDVNAFVCDAGVKNWQVALLTSLSLQQNVKAGAKQADGPMSVRLEMGRVDTQGRLRQEDKKLLELPLKEPPTLEFGFFVPAPLGKVGRNFTWDVADPGKPMQRWQVVGTESCGGLQCIKVTGVQQSDDWDQIRADTVGWRRRDTIWIHPQLFVAQKVERIVEHRAAARETPTSRNVIRYELESFLTHLGRAADERKADALKAGKLQEDARVLLRQPVLNRTMADALIHRVGYHLEQTQSQQPTPYRKVALHVKDDLEKAKKGELPVRSQPDEPPLTARPLDVGRRAPDFAAASLVETKTHRLGDAQGKPAVVFFFNPSTALGREVLAYAKKLSEKQGERVAVLALAITQDADLVRAQHKELKLTFPILDGSGLRLSYGATDTPRFVVLDGDMVVRFAETGWGTHTADVIEEALRQIQARR